MRGLLGTIGKPFSHLLCLRSPGRFQTLFQGLWVLLTSPLPSSLSMQPRLTSDNLPRASGYCWQASLQSPLSTQPRLAADNLPASISRVSGCTCNTTHTYQLSLSFPSLFPFFFLLFSPFLSLSLSKKEYCVNYLSCFCDQILNTIQLKLLLTS